VRKRLQTKPSSSLSTGAETLLSPAVGQEFGDFGPMRLNGARMTAEGSRSDDFDISTDDVADLRRPRVAMHRDGTSMVVWRSQDAGYSRVFCDTAGRRLGCGTSRCLSLPRSAGVVDITATDALAILAAAAGATSCPRCVCDVDSSGEVVATDASTALLRSVGLNVDLICPAC
jgi:hypothetical protein